MFPAQGPAIVCRVAHGYSAPAVSVHVTSIDCRAHGFNKVRPNVVTFVGICTVARCALQSLVTRRSQKRGSGAENSKRPQLLLRKGRQVRLLVDADSASPDHIKQAIVLLQENFKSEVVTQIFAGTERKSKNLRQLLGESDVSLVAVPRLSQHQLGEAIDEAIVSQMHSLAKLEEVTCIAVMTSDKGFAATMKQVASETLQFVAPVPSKYPLLVEFYEAEGIPVFQLQDDIPSTKVRAILHIDGSGSVQFADAYNHLSAERAKIVSKNLYDFFRSRDQNRSHADFFLVPSIAKLWFANGLGPLVVYPTSFALDSLHDAIRVHADGRWNLDTEELAFFLPTTQHAKSTAQYGTRTAAGIYKGGGPFMLRDSEDLPILALRKLGYLDDELNSDLNEALHYFINTTRNKKTLRKLQVTVDSDDASSNIISKLRRAFLSNFGIGEWQICRAGGQEVLNVLKSEELLPNVEADLAKDEIFFAMKAYTRIHQLEEMRTYNCLASRIIQHARPNKGTPNRGTISFKT